MQCRFDGALALPSRREVVCGVTVVHARGGRSCRWTHHQPDNRVSPPWSRIRARVRRSCAPSCLSLTKNIPGTCGRQRHRSCCCRRHATLEHLINSLHSRRHLLRPSSRRSADACFGPRFHCDRERMAASGPNPCRAGSTLRSSSLPRAQLC